MQIRQFEPNTEQVVTPQLSAEQAPRPMTFPLKLALSLALGIVSALILLLAEVNMLFTAVLLLVLITGAAYFGSEITKLLFIRSLSQVHFEAEKLELNVDSSATLPAIAETFLSVAPKEDEDPRSYVRRLVQALRMRDVQLSRLHEHYELLTINIAASVIITDQRGKVTFCSPYTEVLTGYSSDDILTSGGGFFDSIVHEDDLQRYHRAKQISQLGEEIVVRYRINHRSGIALWVETHLVPVLNRNGLVVSIMGLSIDVTQSVRYQERIEEQNQDLNDFSYMVSHDLKAPIFTIKGMATCLEQDLEDSMNEESLDSLKHIAEAAGRLEELAESVIEYSSLSTKPIEVTDVNLANVFTNVLDDLDGKVKETNAVINLPEAFPTVRGNSLRLYQVFSNLLSNSLKYRDPARALEIDIKLERRGGDTVALTVTDNGLGIPEEKLEDIFRAYHRAHGKDIEGSGIGLACVKKIIERFDGSVIVDSTLGKGSTFTVLLKGAKPSPREVPDELARWYE